MDPAADSRVSFDQDKTRRGPQRSQTRISMNSSPAKRTSFIPSPVSPAKSFSGAVLDNSKPAIFPTDSVLSMADEQPSERQLGPPPRHPKHNYSAATQHDGKHRGGLMIPTKRSFFDPDSSDLESPLHLADFAYEETHDTLVEKSQESPHVLGLDQRLITKNSKIKDDDPLDDLQVAENDRLLPRSSPVDVGDDMQPLESWYAQYETSHAAEEETPARPSSEIFSRSPRPSTNNDKASLGRNSDIPNRQSNNMTARSSNAAEQAVLDWNGLMHNTKTDSLTSDRFVEGFKIFVDAIKEDSRNHGTRHTQSNQLRLNTANMHGQQQDPVTAQSPIRPQRPHQETDEFIARRASAVASHPLTDICLPNTPVSTRQPLRRIPSASPPSKRISALSTKVLKRAKSLPQVQRSSNGKLMKHVELESPQAGLGFKDYHFRAPELHTPFPYPAQPKSILTSSRQRDNEFAEQIPKQNAMLSGFKISGLSNATQVPLSVRRRRQPHRHRQAMIIIPRDFYLDTPDQSKATKTERHFEALDFDDSALSHLLRQAYFEILISQTWISRQWKRWFSARCLRHIMFVYDEDEKKRSHKDSVTKGSYSFPEGDLLRLFNNPKKGKGEYAMVQWIQRDFMSFADDPVDLQYPVPVMRGARDKCVCEGGSKVCMHQHWECEYIRTPRERVELGNIGTATSGESMKDDMGEDKGQGKGIDHFQGTESKQPLAYVANAAFRSRRLHFEESWSLFRIVLAIILVALAAIALCLLWIFLGPDSDLAHNASNAAAQNRAAKVGTACLLGIVLLLLGWSGVGAWIWISWLVM